MQAARACIHLPQRLCLTVPHWMLAWPLMLLCGLTCHACLACRHTCFFLAVGQEVMQQRRVQWPAQQQQAQSQPQGQQPQQVQAAEQVGQ